MRRCQVCGRDAYTNVPSCTHCGGALYEVLDPNQRELFNDPLDAMPGGVYDGSPGHAVGVDTSENAARVAAPRVRKVQLRVLNAIKARGEHGGTVFELIEDTGIKLKDSVAPACTALRKCGMIRDSGMRRPSPSGNPCIVWVATDLGRSLTQGGNP